MELNNIRVGYDEALKLSFSPFFEDGRIRLYL